MHDFLLGMLQCPACHAALAWEASQRHHHRIEEAEARCVACGAVYPVREGIGLSGPAVQGGSVQVTLCWQAEGTPSLSYKVFATWSTRGDDYPLQGSRLTTTWAPGEIVVDTYEIGIGADVPLGSYTLKVGFYDAATGDRLGPVRDATGAAQPHDQIVLGTMEVLGP